jgi:hypothetical protein
MVEMYIRDCIKLSTGCLIVEQPVHGILKASVNYSRCSRRSAILLQRKN